MNKVTFCKFKLYLQVTNIPGILSNAVLRFYCKFRMKIIFNLPINTDKPKFVAFLVFACTTASLNRSNIVSRKCLERDVILAPVAKQ